MNKNEAQRLIEKYRNGTCTPEEKIRLEQWYNTLAGSDRRPDLSHLQESMQKVWDTMSTSLDIGYKKRNYVPYLVAASLLLVGFLSFFYLSNQSIVGKDSPIVHDATPGQADATLTLETGQALRLSGQHQGISFLQGDIRYADGVSIYYSSKILQQNSRKENYVFTNKMNTIEVPLGGSYHIILADGSKVWLNSGSKLIFPSNFNQGSSRDVSLIGEAYFDVVNENDKQFTVKTNDQLIHVLGTEFNVRAYPDQSTSQTTLIDGSVEIVNTREGKNFGSRMILSPEEQGEVSSQGFIKTTVDTQKTIAWKEGIFLFNDDKLTDIMQSLARWYRVDVDYASLPDSRFNGYISKQVNLSQVLEMLEITGNIHFKLENNTIKASPKSISNQEF